jgi:hypothetical protein
MLGLRALSLTAAVIISGDESAARGGPAAPPPLPALFNYALSVRARSLIIRAVLGGVQKKTRPVCAQLI